MTVKDVFLFLASCLKGFEMIEFKIFDRAFSNEIDHIFIPIHLVDDFADSDFMRYYGNKDCAKWELVNSNFIEGTIGISLALREDTHLNVCASLNDKDDVVLTICID